MTTMTLSITQALWPIFHDVNPGDPPSPLNIIWLSVFEWLDDCRDAFETQSNLKWMMIA